MTKIVIPNQSSSNFEIEVIPEKPLFILGPNGSGKSALMQRIYTNNANNSKRILAHRKTWFENDTMSLTSQQRNDLSREFIRTGKRYETRYKDQHYNMRTQVSIYDLINSINNRARKITKLIDEEDEKKAKKLSKEIKSPLKIINEILKFASIPISIEQDDKSRLLVNRENNDEPYSVIKLSDGERNALLLSAEVLTAKKETLILIDEPEKHLHRSIISPLLTKLFKERKDCSFIISTHEVFLPIDYKGSNILLLRDCEWNGEQVTKWEADFIKSSDEIPDDIKIDILGARRKILFVEGKKTSLDLQIYNLLFPNITVKAVGSCTEVEKAVKGINNTSDLNWIKAYGLIDKDDRTSENIEKLKTENIFALDCYAVETLYYNQYMVKNILNNAFNLVDKKSEIVETYENIIYSILNEFENNKETLCARLVERKIRNSLIKQSPNHKDIKEDKIGEIKLEAQEIYSEELSLFQDFFDNNKIDELLKRYPVKNTNIPSIVSNKIFGKAFYEGRVRTYLEENEDAKHYLKGLLSELSDVLGK